MLPPTIFAAPVVLVLPAIVMPGDEKIRAVYGRS
jgi:hypothetical protein